MTKSNPYSSPKDEQESKALVAKSPSTKRLWVAFSVAPSVAPLVAAIVVCVGAFAYQATHPEDVEVNPMSMIIAPAILLITGIPASYAVAGTIGMPIAFWLRNRERLNGYSVHAAAGLATVAIAVGLRTLALPIIHSERGELPGLAEWVVGALVICVSLLPFILLSATTFWLVGVRWQGQVTSK
ncbi:MAG: hypothetical protein OSA98_14845 [Rubripirellula sp.]|nr:hypothetical protein [Rubripirellula sp.]